MRVISPLDLRRSLGAILDAASAGERFVIERDRRPLAMLVSVEDGRRLEPDADDARARRLAALDRLEALGRRTATSRPPGEARAVVAPPVPAPRASAPHAPNPQAPDPEAPPPLVPASLAAVGPSVLSVARATGVRAAGSTAIEPIRTIDRYEAERRRHAAEGDVVPRA